MEMKQLTCEMCGSNDLLKQDGVFVCQTCGTKYSVEEAKKMMMEVSGTVQVANMAQVESLLKLAKSSFDSENYAKAEDFCNQILAMNEANYEAWRLKGEAINGQIGANTPRLEEVFNCIMMAYDVSSDDKKEERSADLMSWLIGCFKSEIKFWLNQIGDQRPTKGSLQTAKNSFVDCWNKTKQAMEKMGFDDELKNSYLNALDNYFISTALISTVNIWQSTVAYNYYRDTYKNGRWTDCDYRPTDNIFSTFIDEGGILISLLYYCVEQFNDKTEPSDKATVYRNIAFIHKELCKAESFTPMVRTTTVYGYTSSSEYWEKSKSLTREAKASRQKTIAECEEKAIKYEAEATDKEERIKKEEAQKRYDAYWTEHQEDKVRLEQEKAQLEAEIKVLNDEISNIPGLDELNKLAYEISDLMTEKSSYGLFKIKEKKAIQEKIDVKNIEFNKIEDRMAAAKAEIQKKITPLQNRANTISNELKKPR